MTAVLLAIGMSAVPAAAQTFGARSAHHELKLLRIGEPPAFSYDVEVVDVDHAKSVLNTHLEGKAGVEAVAEHDGERILVRIDGWTKILTAKTTVTRDATIVDEFRAVWILEPQPVTPAPAAQHLDAAGAFRVGGDVKAPVVIHHVEPLYPDAARRGRISGIVILEVVIRKDGTIKDAAVLKGLPDGLSEAAVDAVRKWTFKPGTLNGEPVDVIFNLTINFKLDAPPPSTPER